MWCGSRVRNGARGALGGWGQIRVVRREHAPLGHQKQPTHLFKGTLLSSCPLALVRLDAFRDEPSDRLRPRWQVRLLAPPRINRVQEPRGDAHLDGDRFLIVCRMNHVRHVCHVAT